MSKTDNILTPLVGFGKIRFGMTIDQVTQILGAPSEKNDDVRYGEDPDDTATELIYDDLGLSLSFDAVENFRLTDIMTEDDSPFVINDKIAIGARKTAVIKAALDADFGPYKELDLEEDATPEELEEIRTKKLQAVEFTEMDLNLWFRDGLLETIQMGPEFDEDDNIVWPETSDIK